jgi:hypothetical protein
MQPNTTRFDGAAAPARPKADAGMITGRLSVPATAAE